MAAKKTNFSNADQVYAFLQARGISKQMIQQIRAMLAEDALTNGETLAYNRIYTAVALTARRSLKFGPKRLLKFLSDFNKVCASVLDEDREWPEIMKELDEETGIIIRMDEKTGHWLCEYKPDDGAPEVDLYNKEE